MNCGGNRNIHWQSLYDAVIGCWEFQPGLNKSSFTPRKLMALPYGAKLGAYTDTSILFDVGGWRIYGHYEWTTRAWVFEKENARP